MIDITATEEWKALLGHRDELAPVHLRDLFARDPGRATRFTAEVGDLYVDYSKHRITGETLRLLAALADRAGLADRVAAMFSGRHVNTSEDRAVLHTALRLPRDAELVVDGQDVVADVHATLDAMGEFTDRLRSGEWTGATGKRIRTVVNIGIGGSDLGPAMAFQALRRYADAGISCRFVSNLDPADLAAATRDLDPAETLFVIVSKTFTTLETLSNAAAAKRWLLAGLGIAAGDGAGDGTGQEAGQEAVARHFVAVSTNAERVRAFGIDTRNRFGFWDWVGGRYSVDSAVGLSLMCAIGRERFAEFLAGFHTVDRHFRDTPPERNLPVLLGLLGVWYSNFLGAQSKAVLPYSADLGRFPAYLQQLTMESNGKSVRADGTPVTTTTGEIYWGEPGTNGQHAFYQLLHQGTWLVPADFIGFAEPAAGGGPAEEMHDLLTANFLAQPAVLAFGQTADEIAGQGVDPDVVPHKVMPGNRPSTVILAPRLTPAVLGQLIALYEHIVFVQGAVWGINPFDQWGVELGKATAKRLAPALTGQVAGPADADPSTGQLVARYRQLRGRR